MIINKLITKDCLMPRCTVPNLPPTTIYEWNCRHVIHKCWRALATDCSACCIAFISSDLLACRVTGTLDLQNTHTMMSLHAKLTYQLQQFARCTESSRAKFTLLQEWTQVTLVYCVPSLVES